jgi:hypothetical protein
MMSNRALASSRIVVRALQLTCCLLSACVDPSASVEAHGSAREQNEDAGMPDCSAAEPSACIAREAPLPKPEPTNPSLSARPLAAPDAGDAEVAVDRLPCALESLLAQHCWHCHGQTPQFAAPMSLVSWSDLQRPAPTRGDLPTYAYALERARSDTRPMPPAPHARLSSSELSLLSQWISAATPKGSEVCATTPTQAAAARVPKPADCDATYELRAHAGDTTADTRKYTIPAQLDDSYYQCFYFAAPDADDTSLFWYEPVIDNAAHIHHWIMYATAAALHAPGSSGRCNSAEAGAYMIAGWGPGMDNASLAPDVGMRLPTGPKAGLVLELHYFNDSERSDEDASGVRFCTGPSARREHSAAVHVTGSEGICLEPGARSEVSGICKPRTDLGDIHITGIWPHMHKHARRMRVTIQRKQGASELVHDEPFDFQNQLYYLQHDIVLHPGDSLETRCYYQNSSNQRVGFGESTQQEMCYAFVTAWPAGALSSPELQGVDTRSDLLNRCANPLSVLASCNGLLDGL